MINCSHTRITSSFLFFIYLQPSFHFKCKHNSMGFSYFVFFFLLLLLVLLQKVTLHTISLASSSSTALLHQNHFFSFFFSLPFFFANSWCANLYASLWQSLEYKIKKTEASLKLLRSSAFYLKYFLVHKFSFFFSFYFCFCFSITTSTKSICSLYIENTPHEITNKTERIICLWWMTCVKYTQKIKL